MKTKQDIQSKLQALKSLLDYTLKQRDDCDSTHTYMFLHNEATQISDQIRLLEWVLEDTK